MGFELVSVENKINHWADVPLAQRWLEWLFRETARERVAVVRAQGLENLNAHANACANGLQYFWRALNLPAGMAPYIALDDKLQRGWNTYNGLPRPGTLDPGIKMTQAEQEDLDRRFPGHTAGHPAAKSSFVRSKYGDREIRETLGARVPFHSSDNARTVWAGQHEGLDPFDPATEIVWIRRAVMRLRRDGAGKVLAVSLAAIVLHNQPIVAWAERKRRENTTVTDVQVFERARSADVDKAFDAYASALQAVQGADDEQTAYGGSRIAGDVITTIGTTIMGVGAAVPGVGVIAAVVGALVAAFGQLVKIIPGAVGRIDYGGHRGPWDSPAGDITVRPRSGSTPAEEVWAWWWPLSQEDIDENGKPRYTVPDPEGVDGELRLLATPTLLRMAKPARNEQFVLPRSLLPVARDVIKDAAEERAAAERKAAEDRAAAERKAAEDRAAAERKAAEDRAAAERKAAEERQRNQNWQPTSGGVSDGVLFTGGVILFTGGVWLLWKITRSA